MLFIPIHSGLFYAKAYGTGKIEGRLEQAAIRVPIHGIIGNHHSSGTVCTKPVEMDIR
jgi:hypothetical protein